MRKKDLSSKRISRLIKLYILTHKKKCLQNALKDAYVMCDKNGHLTLLLNYLVLERENFDKRIFELNTISFNGGRIKCQGASFCEIIEYKNESKKIYINFIGTTEKSNLGKGYNYMILRALEDYAIEQDIERLYGLYLPLYPGNEETAHKFYERNDFTHYFDYSCKYPSNMIEKQGEDFRSLSFSKINDIKISSDVFENKKEETCSNLND